MKHPSYAFGVMVLALGLLAVKPALAYDGFYFDPGAAAQEAARQAAMDATRQAQAVAAAEAARRAEEERQAAERAAAEKAAAEQKAAEEKAAAEQKAAEEKKVEEERRVQQHGQNGGLKSASASKEDKPQVQSSSLGLHESGADNGNGGHTSLGVATPTIEMHVTAPGGASRGRAPASTNGTGASQIPDWMYKAAGLPVPAVEDAPKGPPQSASAL